MESYTILSYPILYYPMHPGPYYPILYYPILSYPILSYIILSYTIESSTEVKASKMGCPRSTRLEDKQEDYDVLRVRGRGDPALRAQCSSSHTTARTRSRIWSWIFFGRVSKLNRGLAGIRARPQSVEDAYR